MPASVAERGRAFAVQGDGRPVVSADEEVDRLADQEGRLVDRVDVGVLVQGSVRAEQPHQGRAVLLAEDMVRLVLRGRRADRVAELLNGSRRRPGVQVAGTYSGSVTIGENTPYQVAPVAVTMNVTPPTTWSKLMGTVTGMSSTGISAPLLGATVQVDSWAQSYAFITDKNGGYAYWLDRRNNPLTLIAAKDGYKPQTRTTKLIAGEPVIEDFALKSIK